MGINRIATYKLGKSDTAVLIEVDGKPIEITYSELSTYNTEKKIENRIDFLASKSKVDLPEIFIHKNRDGSVAVATGQEPDIWPEDEKEIG